MSRRPVLSERRVPLNSGQTLRVAVEQGHRGGIVVTLGVEVRVGETRNLTPVFDLPPTHLRQVASALEQLAGEIGVEP
jgi:hypothetical protein